MTNLPEMNNTHILMRHERSIPNENGIIVSHLENGIKPENGLAAGSAKRARETALAANLPEDTVVVTSPFSRCYQTGEAVYRALNADEFIVDERLRERGFGDMEFESADLYHDVWARDALSATHRYRGVESLCQVAERRVRVLTDLEKKFAGRTIVIVGHADPENIFKAFLWGQPLRAHHKKFSIGNGEMQTVATMRAG